MHGPLRHFFLQKGLGEAGRDKRYKKEPPASSQRLLQIRTLDMNFF
jgi:hypothetical protein